MLTDFTVASHLYRLFIILTNNDLGRAVLHGCFGPEKNNQVLLTLFEIALFNKLAINTVKSGALMFQRERLNDYFTYYEQDFMLSVGDDSVTQIRMYYAMMYYAFEIKNNMHASINYFQKLQYT